MKPYCIKFVQALSEAEKNRVLFISKYILNPETEWFHVYTDGSKLVRKGAGALSKMF